VGAVLQQLARQLHKQLQVDPPVAASDVLRQRVSFEVQQADLDELLAAACEPVGLVAQIKGDTIHLQTATE
jgi:hypothetical protein